MKHFWILDVLTDLEKFSAQNGMVELADQIGKCRDVAVAEIGPQPAAKELQKVSTGN